MDEESNAEGYFTVLDPEAKLEEENNAEGGEGERVSKEDVSATIIGGGGQGNDVS